MRVGPLDSGFGARVDQLALYEIGDSTLSDVLSLLEEWGLLLFPRQALDDCDLHAFATRIGSLEEPSRKISLSPQFPSISYLSNFLDESGRNIGFPGSTTDFWHSDQQHRENPATLALLYCVVPARTGGATSFVSTDVDRTGLCPDLIERLTFLRAAYEPAHNFDNAPAVRVSHPALLVSPKSGRRFSYVSENTIEFPGIGKEEKSAVFKQQVLNHLLHPSRIYSHNWHMGDLILYDNAQLMHRRDHFEGRRWLKGTKIFAPKDLFAVPAGLALGPASQAETSEVTDAPGRA
jgi:taurine dioxygenase